MRKVLILGSAVFILLLGASSVVAAPSVQAVWSPMLPDHIGPGEMFVADCLVDPDDTDPQTLVVRIIDPDGQVAFQIQLPGLLEYHLEWVVPDGALNGVYEYQVQYIPQCCEDAVLRGGFMVAGQVTGLCAIKYYDQNGDGVFDNGEPFLEGWEICAGGEMDLGCLLTDEDGIVCWFDIAPGDYTACETLQMGWTNTTPLCQDIVVVDGEVSKLLFGNIEEPTATQHSTWGAIKNIYR